MSISCETSSNEVESKLTINENSTWNNVEITNSLEDSYNQRCHNLLKIDNSTVTSTLGDINFKIGSVEYTIDRVILASKSNYFFEFLNQPDEKDITSEISNLMKNCGSLQFSEIVELIYGGDLQRVITKSNFSQLLAIMNKLQSEIDLQIFEDFIEETIKPKAELNDLMFDLYNILSNNGHTFDYLLPSAGSYFSDRLLKIYRRKEFLSLSADGFIHVLLNKTENSVEKGLIGRICAEWICNDFQNRKNRLKDLVNVAKYRYGILPYYDGKWNPDSIKSSQVPEVEKYFNELFIYHGKVNFGSPSILKDELRRIESGVQFAYSNQVTRWMEILEKSLFCDVAINVQGTVFKLHRAKLVLASEYFRNLFVDQNESSESSTTKVSNSINSTIKEYSSLDQIDPVTFQSIIRYIYSQQIEVTSETHLINLIECSKSLEMKDLFEECSSIILKIANSDSLENIFEIFRCVYENAKHSELYDVLSKKIINIWPKLDENPHFINISLDILKEILAIPELPLENPDYIVSLCSKWIFHDIETRYQSTIEVAKAINQNYMVDNDQLKLEMPSNSTDYTLNFIEEQLNRILSSTALVPIHQDYMEKEKKKPKFLVLNENEFLCVMDGYFNEIIQLARMGKEIYRFSATTIDDELFILFNIAEKFYFQSYSLAISNMVSLGTDAKMSWNKNYRILSCNNEVYYCDENYVLKYIPKLNRWVTFLGNEVESKFLLKYTSDGKKIYKIFKCDEYDSYRNTKKTIKTSFYNFERRTWISMPNIQELQGYVNGYTDDSIRRINLNMINHELGVLISSKIYTFSWTTQTWKNISNSNSNFVEFTGREQNIVFISDKNEVHIYSPHLNQWKLERKLPNLKSITAIHDPYN